MNISHQAIAFFLHAGGGGAVGYSENKNLPITRVHLNRLKSCK